MNKLRAIDIVILVVFLSTAAYGIYLFRDDLMRTLEARDAEPAGIVVIRDNVVQRRHDDRVLWDRLFVNSYVYSGDLIRAAEMSSALMNLGDNEIFLGENTLIRIQSGAGGFGPLRVELREGSVSITGSAEEDSQDVFLEFMGSQIQAGKGAALDAEIIGDSIAVQVNEGTASFVTDGETRKIEQGELAAINSAGKEVAPPLQGLIQAYKFLITPDTSIINIKNPSVGSIYRYQTNYPQIRFQWEHKRLAQGYVIEVSEQADFSRLKINMQVSFASFVTSDLGPGTWFWRVKPVFASMFEEEAEYSYAGFFTVEQTFDAAAAAIEAPEEIAAPAAALRLPPIQPRLTPERVSAPRRETHYTVKPGDTLGRIAAEFYGDGALYIRIVEANNIANPDLIYPEQVFVLP